MATLYLTEQGSELRKVGDRLVVHKDGLELLEIECFKVDSVLLFGGVELTTPAVTKLLGHGIDLALLTTTGQFKGKLVPPLGKNSLLRVLQHERYADLEFCLEIGRSIVAAKIGNCRSVLSRHARNHRESGLSEYIQTLSTYHDKARQTESVDSLRGIEGAAARQYFEGLGRACRRELSFPGRRRRPPTDPINALLSLGYALLTRELWALAEAVGLDPYLGFYHAVVYGRPSLPLDLLEELRAPVVDQMVLRVTNRGQFKADDFEPDPEDGGVRLTPDALRRFLACYEKAMQGSLRERGARQLLPVRELLRRQVERLLESVRNRSPYRALEVDL
jgi:CRISPR-associated protein Cas1